MMSMYLSKQQKWYLYSLSLILATTNSFIDSYRPQNFPGNMGYSSFNNPVMFGGGGGGFESMFGSGGSNNGGGRGGGGGPFAFAAHNNFGMGNMGQFGLMQHKLLGNIGGIKSYHHRKLHHFDEMKSLNTFGNQLFANVGAFGGGQYATAAGGSGQSFMGGSIGAAGLGPYDNYGGEDEHYDQHMNK